MKQVEIFSLQKNAPDTTMNFKINAPRSSNIFFEGDKTSEKEECSRFQHQNQIWGVSNYLIQSLITFDRGVECWDIKADSVTKLPQYKGTYEGILCLIFPSCSTSHFHKSTQTFISNSEYKAVTHSVLLEMTVLKWCCRYNSHTNLVHLHFKTLNVIIFSTTQHFPHPERN